MKVELTEDIRQEVRAQAVKQLVGAVMAELNVKQMAAEVKNAVISKAAKELSQKFGEAYQTNEVVERAVQSAESRVQSKVTELLRRGITVSFTDQK